MGAGMKYHLPGIAALLAVIMMFASAVCFPAAAQEAAPVQEDAPEPGGFTLEQVHFTIPGMEGSCRILWISDMHICSYPDDPEVKEESASAAQERHELLRDAEGISSCEKWKILSEQADSFGADYVVFGADMLDYASAANLDVLQDGLDRIRTPWMYIRADHDYGRWYGTMGIKKMRKLHRAVAPQNKIWVQRFEGFTLVGLDNTTAAIADETVEEFRKICGEGNPVLLCMHVPVDQRIPENGPGGGAGTLAEVSRAAWGDRVLCWGDGDEYDTSVSGSMAELTDLIYDRESPVIGVLAGHLHLTWEGDLTDRCSEHVFSAAYEGNIGMITVSGE